VLAELYQEGSDYSSQGDEGSSGDHLDEIDAARCFELPFLIQNSCLALNGFQFQMGTLRCNHSGQQQVSSMKKK